MNSDCFFDISWFSKCFVCGKPSDPRHGIYYNYCNICANPTESILDIEDDFYGSIFGKNSPIRTVRVRSSGIIEIYQDFQSEKIYLPNVLSIDDLIIRVNDVMKSALFI
jgi:hypothetical protein